MGRFIDRLKEMGVWDNTIFVFTSDHGEEFDEHGSWYQELINVPLLVHAPGVPASRVSETVSTIDIASTVMSSVGLPNLPQTEGRDILGFTRGEAPPGPTVAFSDFLNDRRVIRAGRWKMVLRGINATLFDLESDPGEQTELDRHDHPVAMRYLRIMIGQFLGASDRQKWQDANQGQGVSLQSEGAEMDDTIRSQLRALGYAN